MSSHSFGLEDFESKTLQYVELLNSRLGTKILDLSDEFFASATNLINPKVPVSHRGEFVASGAVYDGWETRRHNPKAYDYVIFQLGVSQAKVLACEVDTAFFSGNEAPAFSVEAYAGSAGRDNQLDDSLWVSVFTQQPLGPSTRHFFIRDNGLTSEAFSIFRLCMYPDGGIARFRLYGEVVPSCTDMASSDASGIDTASIGLGGRVVAASSTHFGSHPSNLLLPGRGSDMGDGWETARSRVPNHNDWVVVRLGSKTDISKIVVDTAFYRGNFPRLYTVHAIESDSCDVVPDPNSGQWRLVIESAGKADSEDVYRLKESLRATHVKLTIYPDGGIKRLRVFGKPINP